MIASITRFGLFALQSPAPAGEAARVLRDSVVAIQVPVARGTFGTIVDVVQGVLLIVLLLLLVGLAVLVWRLARTVTAQVDKLRSDLAPVLRHLGGISDDINYLTTAVRSDVQQVQQTIMDANAKLSSAVHTTERRLTEFSALLDVVQREAEHAFVSTAATVHGVRAGAAILREPLPVDDADDGQNTLLEDEEPSDGYDDAAQDITEHERPRVRPRPSTQGTGRA